jgi:nucleotide-binding universal stress UspA family protein
MNEKVKILCPVDFSDSSDKTFDTAEFFAEKYDGEMILLHVLEAPTGPMKLFSSWDEDEARKKVNKMMDDLIAKHGDRPIPYLKMVKVGKPYKAIIEAANELNANLVVMGTNGASGMSEVLVGSNSARVVRQAPNHTLTIRNTPDHIGFRKILVPLDLTKETAEKVNLAIEFANKFGAEVAIMTVLQTEDEEVKKRLQKRMEMSVEFMQKHHVKADSSMVHSKDKIADVVIEYGKQVGADMILIMTQNEAKLTDSIMGSSAERIVNHSPIPVMAVKPKREYKTKSYSGSHFG